MTIHVLYRLVALFLLLIISACGGDGGSSPQSEASAFVTLTADKTQVIADGTDGVTLTATVKDASGAPLAYQVVSFAVPHSFLYPPIVRHTDENGQLVLFLRPSALLQLGIPAATTQADITATSVGITSTPVTITINPKPAQITASVTLVSDKAQATADGRDTITFTATVKDATGTPIPWQAISFQVPPGPNPFVSSFQTDGSGRAVIRLTMPPSVPGPDKVFDVTATSGAVTSNTVTVTFSNPPQVPPALVTLTSDKTTLIADGSGHVVFTIRATDSNGDPLAGQLYHLNVSSPYIFTTQIITDSAGTATASLSFRTGGVVPAVISVTATINGVTSNSIDIAVSPP
jgi:adhesin/invasin